jgi:hypothetical protein
MVGVVTAKHLSLYAAKQLHVELPPELILMDTTAPITQFGSFKVPLNLKDETGRQVELSVQVNRTYRCAWWWWGGGGVLGQGLRRPRGGGGRGTGRGHSGAQGTWLRQLIHIVDTLDVGFSGRVPSVQV